MQPIRIIFPKERVTGRCVLYVCVCNAIRECDLRKAARCCPGNAKNVYAAMGKSPDCCTCLDDAEAILEEEREFAVCAA